MRIYLPAVWQIALLTIMVLIEPPRAVHADEPEWDSSRWESAIAKFEAADRENQPPPDGIVFVGSSSIRRWDLPKYFPNLPIINRGFGGSQIADATHFMNRIVVKYRPRVVVFYAGDNDINSGKSAERVHADFRAFAARLHKALPNARLVYIGIKPSTRRWKLAPTMMEANRLIAADCRGDEQSEFVDIWDAMLGEDGQPRRELFVADGLHPSDTGYQLWSRLVQPFLVDGAADSGSPSPAAPCSGERDARVSLGDVGFGGHLFARLTAGHDRFVVREHVQDDPQQHEANGPEPPVFVDSAQDRTFGAGLGRGWTGGF